MKRSHSQLAGQRLRAGIELLQRPVLPLVSMIQFLFITGPFATVTEVIDELPDPIETDFARYDDPRSLVGRYEQSLRLLESIKTGTVPQVDVIGENNTCVDTITLVSSLCLQKVLTDELEEINSLLCGPCGCDLCCTGPEPGMQQDFFEIPLRNSEVDCFSLERHDTGKSRTCSSLDEPTLRVNGRPFYRREDPGLFHWRDGWSLILPKSSRCPHLQPQQGGCLIYENRPEVCRRPQIFPYVIEKVAGSGKRPVYRLQNTLLAVIDCPYVIRLQDEIAAYGAASSLKVIFKQNKN